ncbi:hypothetical protein ACFXMF_28770 [Embleya sp. NPDC059213]|uniref:hypothetical protein n=1 Tax=Embleya sp. NPDC059213 TaxID=3346771 RepID=UPI0036A05666
MTISVGSESSPTAPGSRFSEAGSAVPSSLPSTTSARRRSAHTSPRRATVCAQKTRSARARAVATIRSTRPGGLDAVTAALHEQGASRNRSSTSSTGQTSSASQAVSRSSSARVAGRNPRASRICVRCPFAERDDRSYFAKSSADTWTTSAT